MLYFLERKLFIINGNLCLIKIELFVFKEKINRIMENKDKNQLKIELTPEVAEGIYSNLAIISHSSSEFVVDFVRIMPGTPKANVKSRIILTPEHAKRLLFALQDNVAKFESQNGKIKLDGGANNGGTYIPPMFGGGEA